MIIVSQDKEEILNFDRIENVWIDVSGEGEFTIEATADTNSTLGHYKTKDRAKEVLQAIAGMYQTEKMFTCTESEVQEMIADKYKEKGIEPFKFEMPKE